MVIDSKKMVSEAMHFGLQEALALTLASIRSLPAQRVALRDSIGRVAATEVYARMDSPPTDTSRKDGYAVSSHETADATQDTPVRLRLAGSMAAGDRKDIGIRSGTTVRVLTGARIPTGADAVVAEEFVERSANDVLIKIPVQPGKNVLSRGSDVGVGESVLKSGQVISPVLGGLLAAGGHSDIVVFKTPSVGIIGTGSEIVEPGNLLADGQLYASNVITLEGWCRGWGMRSHTAIVRDDLEAILNAIQTASDRMDAVITSGGAWTGDYDMVARALERLGWKQLFHRIRMGPGKAVGFGMLHKKPVFVLPGAPPSNLMAFLQIALPGLLALAGRANPGLPRITARLASKLEEGNPDWTDFFFGTLDDQGGTPVFCPMTKRTRLSSIATAAAVASIPEGHDALPEGSMISVQLLG